MIFSELQKYISTLYGQTDKSPVDFLLAFRLLNELKEAFPGYFRKMKVAFLSSFTIQGLPEIFAVNGIFHNLHLTVYSAPYNQFNQEIFNASSGLYEFEPDIIFLFLDVPEISDEDHLRKLVNHLLTASHAKLVFSSFIGSTKAVSLNDILTSQPSSRVAVLDLLSFLAGIGGKGEHWYTKYTDLGDMRLSLKSFPYLAEQLVHHAVAISGARKKCLVLDLDNTLWQGIVGEDGTDGITPNLTLQNKVLKLRDEGIILAVNSKNNLEDVMEAFNRCPNPMLKLDHFSVLKVNWRPKHLNLIEISQELNIGTDSLVFVDDDLVNQDLIRRFLPEVAVVPPHLFATYAGFHSDRFTSEDLQRSKMYEEEKKRNEFRTASVSLEEFLKELDVEVYVEPVNKNNLTRISQLTLKTNQFNLTTRRYSEDQILELQKGGWQIWSAHVKDRFGDYGLTGVCLVEQRGTGWHINNFLLSCRVLGRGVERTFIASLIALAKEKGVEKITAEFISTAKNSLAADFLSENGFKLKEDIDASQYYEYDLGSNLTPPDFIKVFVATS